MDCTTKDFLFPLSLPPYFPLPARCFAAVLPLFCLLLAQIPFKAAKGVSYWYTSREEIVAILTVTKVIVDVYNIVFECLRDYIYHNDSSTNQTPLCINCFIACCFSLSLSSFTVVCCFFILVSIQIDKSFNSKLFYTGDLQWFVL